MEDYRRRVAAMRWLSERQADEWTVSLVMENYLNIDVLRFWYDRGESMAEIRLRCLRFWFPERFIDAGGAV